jgi:hypothetical protein
MILSLVRRDRMSRRLPFLLCAACWVVTAQTALAQAQAPAQPVVPRQRPPTRSR